MNGFKAWILQDLPHVLPPRSFQLPASHLHTTASSRRFWSFFEFSPKQVACRDAKKCPSSKDIVSSSLLSTKEFDDATRTRLPEASAVTSAITLNPKPRTHPYRYELQSIRENETIVNHDDLTSLLDGNPVPRTLKWKLKGYKTLRHEQAGDFAFVPGGTSYDFDILPRGGYGEWTSTGAIDAASETNCLPGPGKQLVAECQRGDSLSLTARAIENKGKIEGGAALKTEIESARDNAEAGGTLELQPIKDRLMIEAPKHETKGQARESKETRVEGDFREPDARLDSGETKVQLHPRDTKSLIPRLVSNSTLSVQKLLSSTATKNGNLKFLPLPKSEPSRSQLKCPSQPSVRYSSDSPKNIPKPSPPSFQQCSENASPSKVEKPSTVCVESVPQQESPKSVCSPSPETTATTSSPPEVPQSSTAEWSTVEHQFDANHSTLVKPKQTKIPTLQRSRLSVNTITKEPTKTESSTYFAPLPSRRSAPDSVEVSATGRSASPSVTSNFKPATPEQRAQPRTSPCAATLARSLQRQGEGGEHRPAGSFGSDGSSMSGNSGGGSRKPPYFSPPTTQQRSSSSKTCGAEGATRGIVNTKNSASNISTNSASLAPRRSNCEDEGMIQGKEICTKPRRNKCNNDTRNNCQREARNNCQMESRNNCQKESRNNCQRETRNNCQRETRKKPKKPCKRYCCPELHTMKECDLSKNKCPKRKNQRRECDRQERSCSRTRRDPTCSNGNNGAANCQRSQNSCNANKGCQRETKGREICTNPTRRNDCQRSCRSTERSCNKERRDRSCKREANSCENRYSCPRGDPDNCTKPRRKDTCNQNNNCQRRSNESCGKRSSSCSGRRDYSQIASPLKRSSSCGSIRNFSTLPTLSFSVLGLGVRANEANHRLYGTSGKKFFGKDPKPSPSCKTSETGKSSKCKKGPAKCLSRKSSGTSCKSEKKSCQSTCGKSKPEKKDPCKTTCGKSKPEKKDPCKTTCGKSKPEKKDPCKTTCGSTKSKSDEYCSNKKQMSMKGKGTSGQESTKDRAERELKEMQECKKGLTSKGKAPRKDKKVKQASPTGLERVISPCKQRQLSKNANNKKGGSKCSTSKFTSALTIGVPSDVLINLNSPVFARQENKSFNVIPERSYSTAQINRSEETDVKGSRNRWMNFWNFTGDEDYNELAVPIVIENQEEEREESSFLKRNWLFSWFK